jgi:hypothetical protein
VRANFDAGTNPVFDTQVFDYQAFDSSAAYGLKFLNELAAGDAELQIGGAGLRGLDARRS